MASWGERPAPPAAMSRSGDRRCRRRIALWLAAGLIAIGSQREAAITRAAAPPTKFATGAPVTILSTEDLQKFGIYFPDMPVGVIAAPGGGYTFFGAGSGAHGFGPGRELEPPGTYKFVGDLDHIAPAGKGAPVLRPGLLPGLRQPSPDGRDFDRDYAAGGAIYAIRDRRWGNQPLLLLLYHGEYHFAGRLRKVYGGLGAAISTNDGDSFVKLGQIVGPYVSRDAFRDSDARGGIFTDGALTEADAQGRPVAATTGAAAVYDYIIFTDREVLGQHPVLVIARARKDDVLDAIARRRPPQFRRYYAADTAAGDLFTQPGIGGRFTPIVTQNDYLAQPQAVYDNHLKKFVLAYMVNQRAIMLRTGDDLLHWSDPMTIIEPATDPQLKIFYPSLVGADGDPAVLGKRFFLYYQQRLANPDRRGFTQPAFLRRTVTVAP
jgi:hypothetical protein